MGNSYEIDHIIPLCRGGDNSYENLMALCHDCNHDKDTDIYLNIINKFPYMPAKKQYDALLYIEKNLTELEIDVSINTWNLLDSQIKQLLKQSIRGVNEV